MSSSTTTTTSSSPGRVSLCSALSMLLLSLLLTAALGLWLPALLQALLGSRTALAIVAAYGAFALTLSKPAVPRGSLAASGKAVLVTGCDSGLGRLLATRLHSHGFSVLAACLHKDDGGEGARALESQASERLRVLQMDVRSDEQVARAKELVQQYLQQQHMQGLWGVVNNAGVTALGDAEQVPVDLYRDVTDVNVWGTVRVTQAFLPLVREAKGRVVNVTSMLARMPVASWASECVSKAAAAAFSDCLRIKLRSAGVTVCEVEPGNLTGATELLSPARLDSTLSAMADALRPGQRDRLALVARSLRAGGATGVEPALWAVKDALVSRWPYSHYHPADLHWKIRAFLVSLLPCVLTDRVFGLHV
uniref:D-beta-hydroxybutyrate dehydrogenase, mitochondrial-like n=1 Tax=Petromyzon marinus TaxID=7757 RepID=A0AAJ7U6C8_PETMA|nr:D-beta-hydroxybutyrate dehydrogenase, mitochondrial-like [Petromyzon marinus]